jgi:DNA (cytosine-5)-methyltransferase 1
MQNSSNNIFLSNGKNADRQKHRFPYEWTLKDANFTKDKGKVFSCFACGGGSTMGYKLAGFDVLGCNEIDPKMMEAYRINHNPKYSYLEPIQTFKLRKDLPKELYNLDILDGSPPCSSFSMAGNREKDWGKEKKFREGQAKQVLDNLFFDFIDLAKELQPKVVVAENVKGLLLGSAKEYVRKIYREFDQAGYYCQHWLLNASKMGVPQKRERVFFICLRKNLAKPFLYQKDMFTKVPKLELNFNEKPILFGEYRDKKGLPDESERSELMKYRIKTDKRVSDINERVNNKFSGFNAMIRHDDEVCGTITSGETDRRFCDGLICTEKDILLTGSYPLDYNFLNVNESKSIVKYFVGMSVPPVMTAQIATKIYEQWLSKLLT